MKKLILMHILMLGSLFATAQSRLDTINIHKKILKVMHLRTSRDLINLLTDKQLFGYIDLTNPSNNTLDTNTTKFWHKKDWVNFLANIDTSSIQNYPLKSGKKPWFKIKKSMYRYSVFVSPAVFNKNNDKALCVLRYSGELSGGAILATFFEKINNIWVIKDVLNLAFLG